jgi:excisionase family DNA binding protein
MKTYELLTGERLDLSGLEKREAAFLDRLKADASEASADYFELLRRVKGREAIPLRGRPITPETARSPLYRAAHDIADRVGIEQGYVLRPDVDRTVAKPEAGLLSMTEAAELIGISRPAVHQALSEERLPGRRVGNAWVVRRSDAEAFKRGRSNATGTSAGGTTRTASARSR